MTTLRTIQLNQFHWDDDEEVLSAELSELEHYVLGEYGDGQVFINDRIIIRTPTRPAVSFCIRKVHRQESETTKWILRSEDSDNTKLVIWND